MAERRRFAVGNREIPAGKPGAGQVRAVAKPRLDSFLVDNGLVDTINRAHGLIMAGIVTVAGQVVDKPATRVSIDAVIEIRSHDCPFVSRGGLKLLKALETFGIEVEGGLFVDAGSSTGGFTDCFLSRGALKVVAVDVGYGQLAWKLRNDPRVSLHERTNIRAATLESLGMDRPADGLAADLSFIGLTRVLSVLADLVRNGGFMVLLIKPQFEACRDSVEKGGVVRDPHRIIEAAEAVAAAASDLGMTVLGIIPSGVETPNGNVEMLLYAIKEGPGSVKVNFRTLLANVSSTLG